MPRTNTKLGRLLKALENGQSITEFQAIDTFGITNVSAAINSLRRQGYAIYLNTTSNTWGQRVKAYRLSTPKRAVVAAGVKALNAIKRGGALVDRYGRDITIS
jgi:hypothetical protein